MSTWQRSCICNIHFILANGTYLATMGIGHWKILLHQDLSTICVPRHPKQCQLLWRQIHCCRLRDAIHFHHCTANLNLLAGILIVIARVTNVQAMSTMTSPSISGFEPSVLKVFTMKFCFKDVVTSDTLPSSPQKVQQTQANHFRVQNVGSLLNQSGSGLGKIEIIQNKVHTQFTITAIIWKNMNDSHRFTAHEFDALK